MDKVQNSAVDEPEEATTQSPPTTKDSPRQSPINSYQDTFNKYSREANDPNNFIDDSYTNTQTRTKRATRPKEDNRNTCSLFIQTDPLIWRHISEQVGNDPEKTREEILSLIAHHVTAVNYIYRDTKFDGRVEHRNIKFEVQRIKV